MDPISTVSHKLRTPLTVIISTVNNLLDGAFGPLSEDQKKWLKKLETHTNNLETISNDLLAFLKENKITSGELDSELMKISDGKISRQPAKISSAAHHENGHAKPTVLIVDDEPDILDVITQALDMEGLKCVTTSSGEDAIRLAKSLNPDVVLLDVLLKGQNGLEICQKIKSQKGAFIPVVMMTGQQDLREKVSGKFHGADEILIKPFQMVELTARVASMLRIKKLNDELQEKGKS